MVCLKKRLEEPSILSCFWWVQQLEVLLILSLWWAQQLEVPSNLSYFWLVQQLEEPSMISWKDHLWTILMEISQMSLFLMEMH